MKMIDAMPLQHNLMLGQSHSEVNHRDGDDHNLDIKNSSSSHLEKDFRIVTDQPQSCYIHIDNDQCNDLHSNDELRTDDDDDYSMEDIPSTFPCETNLKNQRELMLLNSEHSLGGTFIVNIRHLSKLYTRRIGEGFRGSVVTGGLQQYLNRLKMKSRDAHKENETSIDEANDAKSTKEFHFNDFPVCIKLHIFSQLAVDDLCRASGVCRLWYGLTGDDVLWRRMLQQDMRSWHMISHLGNPVAYQEVQSEWTNKEIYIQCCPHIRERQRQTAVLFRNVTNMIRSFLPHKTPKVAMFGPGLESSTKGLVRHILQDSNRFKKINMFPGQFDGVGSGFTLQMRNGLVFNFTILYGASKQERENQVMGDRIRRNRMVLHKNRRVQQDPEGGQLEDEQEYELMPSVRDLCHTLDAFVYVVDASVENRSALCDTSELNMMLNERWSSTQIPLLVMACVPDSSSVRVPCMDIVRSLQLTTVCRPWQVHSCEVEGLCGIEDGFSWAVEYAQRH